MVKKKLTLFALVVVLLQNVACDSIVEAPPKPKDPYCCDGQIVTETVTVNNAGDSSTFDYQTKRQTPKCIKLEDKPGKCERTRNGQFYCMADDIIYTTEIDNKCNCVNKPVKRPRICCCRESTNYTNCDKSRSVEDFVQVDYQLINDDNGWSCNAIEKRISTTIALPIQYTTQVGACNADGYQENIITRKFVDGCEIKTSNRKETRPCACTKKPTVRKECNGDYELVTKTFKSVLSCCECSCLCEDRLESTSRKAVECPQPTITKGECIHNNRLITIKSFELKKCECIPKIKEENERCGSCEYKEYGKTVQPCCLCKDTETITIKYRDTDCVDKEKTYEQPCTCSDKPSIETTCDNGDWKTSTIKTTYDKELHKCIARTSNELRSVICNPKKVTIGKCEEERKYFKKVTTIEENVDKTTCKCKETKKIEFVICDCPKSEETDWVCEQNENLVKSVTSHVINLDRNICDKKTNKIDKVVKCDKPPESKNEKINECEHDEISYYMKIIDCKCKVTEVRRRVVTKCCEPSTTITRCENDDTLVTTQTTYKVKGDRTRCVPVELKNSQKIICQKYDVTSTSPCQNGQSYTITKYFGVKQCKCIQINEKKIPIVVECNTDKPIFNSKCDGDKFIITKTSWENQNCRCVEKSSNCLKNIDCPSPKRTQTECNQNTGNVKIHTITHKVVNCKCVPKHVYHNVPCPCWREDRIAKSKCVGMKRIVNKLRYVGVSKKCRWDVLETETEDCECPRTCIRTRCHRNHLTLTTTTSHDLVLKQLRLQVERCVQRQVTTAKHTVCRQDYTYTTPCKNFKQSVISCTHDIVNCECITKCKTECIRACNCRQKNKIVTKCVNNEHVRIRHRYTNNGHGCGCGCRKKVSKCAKNTIREVIPVVCLQPSPRRICTECIFNKGHGIYRKCTINTREKTNCKCHVKTRVKFVLCKCVDPTTQSFCRNNEKVDIVSRYLKKHEKCVLKTTITSNKIDCPRSYIITRDGVCRTTYALVYYVKEHCQCVEKRRVKSNSKCCIKPIVDKACKKENWVITKQIWIQRSTGRKLFNQISDSPIKTFCEHVINKRSKVVICDRDAIITWCNTKTKGYHKIRTYFIKPNCLCLKKVSESTVLCKKCKRKKEHRGKCDQSNLDSYGYLDLTTIRYKVTERNVCKKHIKHTKELCRCPRRRVRKFCRKGKLVFEAISFVLRSKPLCERQVSVKEKTIHCYNNGKPNAWRPGKIDKCKSPGQYTIQHFERDQFKECSCIKRRKQKKIGICCKPCRHERKCIANRRVLITICERPRGLKCVIVSHAVSSRVECPRPIKKLIGKPVKCVQKYSRTVYINSKCHCLPKTTKRSKLVCCIPRITVQRKCEGQRWKIIKTKFKLVKRKCIPHKTVSYNYLCTCTLHEETTKDRIIDKYTFERTYYRKKIVNCRFVEYVWRQETLNSECRPGRIEKHCKNNRIWVTTKYFFKFCHFRCIPRSKRTQKDVVCKDLVLKERVLIGKCCRAKDIYYKIVYDNCKCSRKIVRVDTSIEICCCHHTPYTKVRCNERGGIITTSHYTFHLSNERCIKSAKHRSVAVNCNRKDCHTSVGPCKNNTNTVTLFCMRRHKCKCIKKIVNQGNQCCKPESYQWKVVGKCNESTRIKKTKYFAFRLDGERKFCRPVVIRIQRKICKCDEKRIVRECIKDTIRKVTTITYTLNEERDTCVRHACEHIKATVGCCRNKRRLGVVGRKCNRKTGWGEITTEYVQAKNCACVKSRKVKRCPCLCKVAFPTQVRSYCKDNKVVTETKTAVCHKCRVRWIVSSKSIRICNCEKIVIEKGNCFPSKDGYAISIRYNSKVQYHSINCKCVRKVIKTWKEHCECRKSRRVVKCQISQILITTFMYFNKNGTCQRLIKKNVTKIPCPSKPKVIKSKCKNNHYNIKTIHYYYGNCICLSKVCIQKCDCRCPKNTLVRRCTGKYFKELIVVTWKIKNCRCIKSVIRRKYCPKCPTYTKKTIEPCVKKGKIGFKRIILRSLSKRSDICKCLVKEHVKYRCCWCKENLKTKKFCIENNKFVTQTSKRVINKSLNKCKRIIVKTTTEAIKVPARNRKYYCNRNTGRDLIKTINFHIENCVPKPTIEKDYGYCTCDKEWKLIKRGKCLRSNRCIRTDTYIRKQLENRRCKDVKEIKIKICCCPLPVIKKYCKDNRLHKSTTIYKLVRSTCPPKESITIKSIICSSRIIVEKGPCNINGYKIIRKYRFVKRNCKCVKELFREIRCKCKCGKQIVKYHCNKAAKVSTKTVTKYAIIRCKCAAKIDIFKTSISCPGKTIEISKCIEIPGKDYSERTTTTITYHINDHCKCVRKTKIVKEKCCCKRMKKIKKRCDNRNHVFITEISFKVLQNKECVWKRKIKKQIICCGSGRWVLKGDSGCIADNYFGRRILTYVRQRAVGCGCKEERKSKVCNCLCRGPLQRRHCDRRTNEIVTTSYHYKLIKCKCVVTTSVTRRKNKCRQLPNITQPCRLWRNGISVIYTIHRDVILINCRCQIIPRKTWIIFKCPPPFTLHKCDSRKNTIVSTRTWYDLFPKKCVKQTKTTIAPVPCDTIPDCTVHSKCKGRRKDRQVHKCIFRRLHNCKCKAETKLINKPCRCGSTKKLRGRCNRETRRRIITIKKYYLRILRNNKTRCIIRVTGKQERCCCRPNPKAILTCVKNKLIETTISFIFNDKCKTCHKIVKEINKTPICCPAKEKRRVCNRKTCNKSIYITERSLVNCKCQVSKRVIVKKCCCPYDFTKKRCLNNRIIRSITHKFNLIRGKCHKRFVVVNKTVFCPRKSNRIIKPCCLRTRTQTREIIFYIIKKCKCLKITKRREEICLCRKPFSKEECIPSRGVFRITFTSYTLDRKRHRCIKNTKISERRPCCNTEPKKICQGCKSSYHCGTYKNCKTTFGVRQFCSCIYRSFRRFELCSCPRSTIRSECTKHCTKLKIKTYYVRVKSQSKYHDFECVKKSKIVKSRKVICPKKTIKKSACINRVTIYTKYFYVALNCVCTLRVKSYKVPCKCGPKKEMSRKCVHDYQTVVVTRYSKLSCDTRRLIPRCKCIHFFKRDVLIKSCRRRLAIVEKCIGKRRRIIFVHYKTKNCKCHRIERYRSVHCKECKGEMKFCGKLKKLSLCKKPLYREHLCQFSCNYCEHCPKKCVTKSISACRCRKVAGIQICTRKIVILSNKHVHRKCVQQKTVKRALCSCSMDYSKSKCEQLKKLGRCKEIKVLRKCQFVCTPSCQLCQGNIRHRSCVQSGNHKATFKLVVVTFQRHCDSCVAQITVTHSGKCLVCSKVQRFEVTSCVHNTRFIIRHYVKKERRVCANKESRIIFSCKGCCRGTETKIGECKNGRRTVVTVFWANVNHCCKKQTVINIYSCNRRCSTVSQVLSQCINNKRMAVKVWKSGRNCESHSAFEIRSCIPIPN